jgi:uncharacterized membrane protein
MFTLGRPGWLVLASLALEACSSADSSNGLASAAVCAPIAPTECPDPAPRFADVAPVIERRCASCHNGTPDGPWALNTYESVADWAPIVRDELLRCSMPPADSGVTLTPEERDRILVWVRCGSLE